MWGETPTCLNTLYKIGNKMAETLTKVRETIDTVTLEPGKYKVVLYNDDKTPIEFVIALLMKVFKHSEESAAEITMKVHHEGSGVAGVYSYEIAEQKGMEGTSLARQNGYPLVIKVEAE
jgi:ATP-dependent Clp protease adaptor protein ClpS